MDCKYNNGRFKDIWRLRNKEKREETAIKQGRVDRRNLGGGLGEVQPLKHLNYPLQKMYFNRSTKSCIDCLI